MIDIILLQIAKNTDSIIELVKAADKYGVSLVVLIVLGIFTWFLIKYLLKRMKKQDNKLDELVNKLINKQNDHGLTDEALQESAEKTLKIQQIIYNLLNDYEADRISIFEYHNGGKTISGLDFKKCSNTYEAVKIGNSEKYKDYQNIPISVNFLWNKLLLDKKPILISNINCLKKTDHTIYSMLSKEGIKSYYSRLICDYNDNPIGFIIITFYNEVVVLSDEQLKKFNDVGIQVGGIINN